MNHIPNRRFRRFLRFLAMPLLIAALLTSVLSIRFDAPARAAVDPQTEAPPASQPNQPSVAVDTAFSYQGQLRSLGTPVTAACDFQFGLWDTLAGGTQVGSTLTLLAVQVTGGLFTVELDFGDQFSGEKRWLETAVFCPGDADYTVLAPRTSLTGFPYALSLRPGAIVQGDGNVLNGVSQTGYGVTGSTQTGYAGVYGASNSYGVYGLVNNADPGAGVFGRNDGGGYGVFGQNSGAGSGAFGLSSSGTGVAGTSSSGVGMAGTSNSSYGVTGSTQTGYAGVYGASNSYGVYGLVNNADPGAGVFGRNDGGGYGVFGQNSGAGSGAFGLSSSGTGVAGTSSSGVGMAGTSNSSYGVTGSTQTGYAGVYGASSAGYGVYGLISGAAPRAGLFGRTLSGDGYGVFGQGDSGAGVFGLSATGVGVYGISTGGGYAGRFDGRVRVNVLEIAGGSDLAERFQQSGTATAAPGTVMVIDEGNAGHLKVSDAAYDTKVAGIVSGAGDVQAGLTLEQEGVLEGDLTVAIAGRVYAQCEAHSGSIQPGDLLTTSSVAGHCMKATERTLAAGAIIGKAMTGLKSGQGLVLVLVSLQ